MNAPPTDGGIQWDKVYLKIPSTEIELNLMEIVGLGLILILALILIWRVSQSSDTTPVEGLLSSSPSPSLTYKSSSNTRKVPVYMIVQKGGQKKLIQKKYLHK